MFERIYRKEFMAASPKHASPISSHSDGVLDRLDQCDHLMTAKELESIVHINAKTLYKYADSGQMPCFKVESNVRFHGPEIAAWLRQRRRHGRQTQNSTFDRHRNGIQLAPAVTGSRA